MSHKITVEQAREYFRHPSQHVMDTHPDNLPAQGVEYWADGPICGAFHHAPWPNVWMAHYGVKPEGWGKLKIPALRVLNAFWAEKAPELIIGWTAADNRAALAFSKRIGFERSGEFHTSSGTVVMTEWRPAWH